MTRKPEDYETRKRKQLARKVQKESGLKYTTILRSVEAMEFNDVLAFLNPYTSNTKQGEN